MYFMSIWVISDKGLGSLFLAYLEYLQRMYTELTNTSIILDVHMKPSKRIIYILGNDAMSWPYGWAPWIKGELDKMHVENVFETFPDSIIARQKYWSAFLKDKLHAGRDASKIHCSLLLKRRPVHSPGGISAHN